MTNLVTSPFGLGEKLILELVKRGESVYTIFPSPKDVPMSFLGKINLKYGFIKFGQESRIEKALPKKVENVFHIYEEYNGSFPHLFKSNTLATLLLLDWAKKVSAHRFIYLSNGEVYGQGQTLTEKNAYKPRSFYATTKFEAEILLRYYHRFYEISTMRIFFPFGKNINQGYISNLFQSIKSGSNLETEYAVVGPTFIDDSIEPIMKLREIKGHQTFNICGSPIKVTALVDEIKKICSKSPKKVGWGAIELFGDNSRAKEVLGYKETLIQEALKTSFGK